MQLELGGGGFSCNGLVIVRHAHMEGGNLNICHGIALLNLCAPGASLRPSGLSYAHP